MNLKEIGEFGFIERIRRKCSPDTGGAVLGIGDDCAVIPYDDQSCLLITTDLLIEHIHFLVDKISFRTLGRKALAVNLSDIAAMGGKPQYAFLSLAIPQQTQLDSLDRLIDGFTEMADAFHVTLLGGDTTSCRRDLGISVTVTGTMPCNQVLYRSGAKIGDAILVSGPLGGSVAGLHILLQNLPLENYPELIAAHNDPEPEVRLGRAVAESRLASAMIDLSDGVASDLGHICAESGVGAEVYAAAVPVHGCAASLARETGSDALSWALYGGEDYRLLLTAPQECVDSLLNIGRCLERELTVIGTIRSGNEVVLHRDQSEQIITGKGFNHFKGQ